MSYFPKQFRTCFISTNNFKNLPNCSNLTSSIFIISFCIGSFLSSCINDSLENAYDEMFHFKFVTCCFLKKEMIQLTSECVNKYEVGSLNLKNNFEFNLKSVFRSFNCKVVIWEAQKGTLLLNFY